jgi:hypothetical protein
MGLQIPRYPEPIEMRTGEDFLKSFSYWAQLIGGRFSDRTERNELAGQWCMEYFGVPDTTWEGGVWNFSNGKFYFKNESDRSMFVLRWS